MICQATSAPRPNGVFFDFVTHLGGAQRSTVSVCSALRPFYRVRVVDPYGVCQPWLQALQEARVPVEVLMPRPRRSFIGHQGHPWKRIAGLLAQIPEQNQVRLRLRQCLDRIGPDWVLTNSTKALALLWLAGAFGRYRIVFYARGWYLRDQVPALGRRLIRRADCVLAVSQATATALQAWGVTPRKLHVVHTLIDPDEVARDRRAVLSAAVPRADGPCRILLPAQLVRTKGQHTAVQAGRLLKDRGLDFVMWLAGDVKRGADAGYREDLVREIASQGLEDRVFLLGHRTDVPALMQRADIVILPTSSEGLPRAIWEAQVLERPVIATPAGGVMDLIEDGRTGLLVPAGEGPALAGAIERLWMDAALRRRIVCAAADHIRREFSYDRQREALRRCLEQTQDVSGNRGGVT